MASHGLTDAQLAACMAASAAWPHAAADDGWVRAHDALREDMTGLRAALEALAAHAAAGKPLTAWQVRARRAAAAPISAPAASNTAAGACSTL